MMERKKRLRLIQLSLLILGFLIIFFTYLNKNEFSEEKIVTTEKQEKIKRQLANQSQDGEVFYNIEYSGLDLAGNRYILKSDEAYNSKISEKLVNMKNVNAVFYFKDGTILNVTSDTGLYNNETLDMDFKNNVKAIYEGSELFAQKAVYSNSKSFLTISDKVIIKDIRGTVFADKLLFDIKKQELNIASFEENKINANVSLK
jgi:LPS export ABC transporter protein LptC